MQTAGCHTRWRRPPQARWHGSIASCTAAPARVGARPSRSRRRPTAGSVTTALAIPNVPTLAGQVFHQQVLPVTFAAAGGLLAVASTNRLTMGIGAL